MCLQYLARIVLIFYTAFLYLKPYVYTSESYDTLKNKYITTGIRFFRYIHWIHMKTYKLFPNANILIIDFTIDS